MSDIKKQLWENQLWETVAFAAKAGFLFILTPLMLKVWGPVKYGEFAIGSSAVVFASILDFGIRGRARVALCSASRLEINDLAEGILARATVSFLMIGVLTLLVSSWLAMLHFWSHTLGISLANDWLIPKTIGITFGVTLSGIWLEPLVARGEIGKLKLAVAGGAALAIPLVWCAVNQKASVGTAILLWQGSLLLTNLLTAGIGRTLSIRKFCTRISFSDFFNTLRDGLWFNLTTITWLLRTHGLTLIVSGMEGPATAGVFFIIVRMAEIISGLGAISCDVLLGALPGAKNNHEQGRYFRQSLFFAVKLAFPCALCLVLFTPTIWRLWLHADPPFGLKTGLIVAALGLSSAANRIMTYTALGLHLGRFAGAAGLLETLAAVFIFFIFLPRIGLEATLFTSISTNIFMAFLAWKIVCVLKTPWDNRILA